MVGNCRVASQLVASRVVLSSIELVSYGLYPLSNISNGTCLKKWICWPFYTLTVGKAIGPRRPDFSYWPSVRS
jgi:hypothetical protein